MSSGTKYVVGAVAAMLAVGLNASAEVVGYEDGVRQVLRKHCVGCHGRSGQSGGLDLSTYESILAGSSAGEVVSAGDADDSFLYLVTAHLEEPAMPPSGKRIPAADLELLRQWIDDGAHKTSVAASVSGAMEMTPPPASTASSARPTTSTGERFRRLPVFRGARGAAVNALAVSPSAGLIAIGAPLQVLLYDAKNLEFRGGLPFPEGDIATLRFTPDGARLIAGGGVPGESGRAVVWDLSTGERFSAVGDEFDSILAADISGDGRRVILGGPGRVLHLHEAAGGRAAGIADRHSDWILDASFSPDGLLLASCDRDGGVYLWVAETLKHIYTLRGHRDAVHVIDWIPGEDVVVTGGADGTIRLWDLHTGKLLNSWEAHAEGVLSLGVHTTGQIVSVGRDKMGRVWSREGEALSAAPFESTPIAIAPLGDAASIVGCHDGSVHHWRTDTGALSTIALPEELVTTEFATARAALPSLESLNATLAKAPAQGDDPPVTAAATPVTAAAAMPPSGSGLVASAAQLHSRLQRAHERLPLMIERAAQLKERIAALSMEIEELQRRPTSIAAIPPEGATADRQRAALDAAREKAAAALASLAVAEAEGEAYNRAKMLLELSVEEINRLVGQDESAAADATTLAEESEVKRQQLQEAESELAALQEEFGRLLQERAHE